MNADALFALQQIDTALVSVHNRRPRLPELAAHQAAREALSAHRDRMAAEQARIDAAAAAIEAAEHAAAELTTKRTRLESQLKTIISPREAEALMHQIDTLNRQRAELDEQELVALDEQAEAEAALAALDGGLPSLQQAAVQAEQAWREADGELDREQSELESARPAAASLLSVSELAAYDRARAHFDGVAIARLEGHRCHGCHLDLSPAEMDVVKSTPAGEVPECPQCGRYLLR